MTWEACLIVIAGFRKYIILVAGGVIEWYLCLVRPFLMLFFICMSLFH